MPLPHEHIHTSASGERYVGVPAAHTLSASIGGLLTAAGFLSVLQASDAGSALTGVVVVASAVIGYLGIDAIAGSIQEASGAGHRRDGPSPHAGDPLGDGLSRAQAFGVEARGRFAGRRFEEVEGVLARQWITARGRSQMYWEQAHVAVRAGWDSADAHLQGGKRYWAAAKPEPCSQRSAH